MGKAQIHAFVKQGFSVVMESFKIPEYGFFINPIHKEVDIRGEFNDYIEKYKIK